MTQALRKLELTAGAPLFERSGFGVAQTDAGRLLVRRAQRATELVARSERELRARLPQAAIPAPLHHHVTASPLRALIAVVDTGGYSTAARGCQPTVHRAARDLEGLVGGSRLAHLTLVLRVMTYIDMS